MAARPRRLSGIQKQVLGLYRSFLREAAKKDRQVFQEHNTQNTTAVPPSFPSLLNPLEGTKSSVSYAKTEFRHQAAQAKRSDFKKIEYMIRKGEKQLKLLKMPGTKVVMGAS